MAKWLIAGSIGVLMLIPLTISLTCFERRLTVADFDRVKAGMTRTEVEKLLGKPWSSRSGGGLKPDKSDRVVWIAEDKRCELEVTFDANGRVTEMFSMPILRTTYQPVQGNFERFRRWIGY
jgi:SmpA / OmlA family